jgi:predicted enzyme related to lactoylglutathione lyase
MEKMKVQGLTGLIMSSTNPEKLAMFYKEVIGLPLELNKHGNLPKHWECDFSGIHYAILKHRKGGTSSNFVPSFAVEDINVFVEQHGLSMLHPLMDLGGGSYVGSINDVDGNTVRLWMTKNN